MGKKYFDENNFNSMTLEQKELKMFWLSLIENGSMG